MRWFWWKITPDYGLTTVATGTDELDYFNCLAPQRHPLPRESEGKGTLPCVKILNQFS